MPSVFAQSTPLMIEIPNEFWTELVRFVKDEERLYSLEEIASLVGVSPRIVRDHARDGRLRVTHRFGKRRVRVTVQEYRRWLAAYALRADGRSDGEDADAAREAERRARREKREAKKRGATPAAYETA